MSNVVGQARRFAAEEGGQGLVEYALILTLVSVVVIVVLLTMGKQLENLFTNVVTTLAKIPS